MPLASGIRLGSHEIVGPLGAGGMGEVYRAHDSKLGRDVAVKVLPADAVADPAARARLEREARLAAALNHPSICTVYDVGESDGVVYVAMELIDGRPLADAIPQAGFSMDRVLKYGAQIAEGLAHAHDRGIVHRDLKGANVVVTPDGRIKILDFGLAARQPGTVEEATRSIAVFDAPGIVAGTLAYMSPEALRGEAADVRSDVWSLGVLLHEMASGRRPFAGTSGVDLTSSIVRDPPSPLPSNVPPGLAAVVERCLRKEPARRYAHAGEVRAALEAIAPAVSQPRPRPATADRLSARLLIVGLLFAIGVALAVTTWRWSGGPAGASPPRVQALAVLPLENLSGDAGQDYLADGITDDLTGRLSTVSGLTVTSRTSVTPFRRSRPPVGEIARQLGVQAVVTGTVARVGDQVRITADLVDATSGKSLWSGRYERSPNDVLTVQGEVASAIQAAIGSSVTARERKRLVSVPSSNGQAYDLYLRGRFHQARETADNNRQAIDFFQRAVEADPRFAAAHAELGRAYGQRLFYYAPGESSLQERAFVAIERALAIDPDLDLAHLARGLLLWQSANQFPHDRAIAEYRRAIELNPNNDEAHHQLALVYLHVGLLDEAMVELQEALRLNPSNTLARFREGVVFLYSGRYAQAADVFGRTPRGFQAALVSFQLADSLFHLGRKAEARALIATYLRDDPEDLGGVNTSMSALLAADAGDLKRAIAAIKVAEDKGKGYGHFHHTAFTIARAYAIAGRARDAVRWLQRAAEDGYPCYPVFVNDKTLDRIRGDESFKAFLADQQTRSEGFKKLVR